MAKRAEVNCKSERVSRPDLSHKDSAQLIGGASIFILDGSFSGEPFADNKDLIPLHPQVAYLQMDVLIVRVEPSGLDYGPNRHIN